MISSLMCACAYMHPHTLKRSHLSQMYERRRGSEASFVLFVNYDDMCTHTRFGACACPCCTGGVLL